MWSMATCGSPKVAGQLGRLSAGQGRRARHHRIEDPREGRRVEISHHQLSTGNGFDHIAQRRHLAELRARMREADGMTPITVSRRAPVPAWTLIIGAPTQRTRASLSTIGTFERTARFAVVYW